MNDLTTAVLELDRATSTPELVQATRAICALNDADAAPTLIKVLSYNNPAVAAIATQGLIALGRVVVPELLLSMNTGNYGARAWVDLASLSANQMWSGRRTVWRAIV